MLYYPDGTIQHAGVNVGLQGAHHEFLGLGQKAKKDPQNLLESIRNPTAVTAAALLIKNKLFKTLNGLDEPQFKIAFNDVVLCLEVKKIGFWNIWINSATLIHHESKTRKVNKEFNSDSYKIIKYIKQFLNEKN
jgi:GT2 family glycosyltransferase